MADVIFKRGTKAEIDAEPISDGRILFTTDQTYNKIYADNGTNRIQIGGTIDVDTTLSTTSTNAISNSATTTAINQINTVLSDILLSNGTMTIILPASVNSYDTTYRYCPPLYIPNLKNAKIKIYSLVYPQIKDVTATSSYDAINNYLIFKPSVIDVYKDAVTMAVEVQFTITYN